MRWWQFTLLAINTILGVFNFIVFIIYLFVINTDATSFRRIYNTDNISISLTIFEALLTVVTIGFGFLAFFGYTQIKTSAMQTARETADKIVREFLSDSEKDTQEEKQAYETIGSLRTDIGTEIPTDSKEVKHELSS